MTSLAAAGTRISRCALAATAMPTPLDDDGERLQRHQRTRQPLSSPPAPLPVRKRRVPRAWMRQQLNLGLHLVAFTSTSLAPAAWPTARPAAPPYLSSPGGSRAPRFPLPTAHTAPHPNFPCTLPANLHARGAWSVARGSSPMQWIPVACVEPSKRTVKTEPRPVEWTNPTPAAGSSAVHSSSSSVPRHAPMSPSELVWDALYTRRPVPAPIAAVDGRFGDDHGRSGYRN
ncbi:hypothetical protein BS50DRAFT_129686 [Corynespora cassiicola Philippines]|uniref:Uncharacterized protein n=1 Tax=Corynespora cassiicola Philippines TaxID=1448308 RepID=A0A2T2NBR7_CORCC|nr:hypothetical protein BS50DRAFT_129686 [Corynespora cassiicola Philippines]